KLCDPFAINGNDDVTDPAELVYAFQSRSFRSGPRCHALDDDAWCSHASRHLDWEDTNPNSGERSPTRPYQLRHDAIDRVDRHGKSDTRESARRSENRRVDANQPASTIDQRTSR